MSECSDSLLCPKTCRTCLTMLDDNMTSTLETKSFHNLSFKYIITTIANVRISEMDGLSEFVCDKCTMDAESAYDFKIRCEASDTILRTKAESIGAPRETKLENEEEEIKEYEVKEEMLEIKSDPSTSDEFEVDITYDDDDKDYDPTDDLCQDEISEDEDDKSFFIKSISSTFKKSNSTVTNKCNSSHSITSTSSPTIKKEVGRPQSTAVLAKYINKYRTNSKKTMYTCQFCKAIFRSAHIQRKHLKKIHGMVFVLPTAGTPQADRVPHTTTDVKQDNDSEYKCSECEFKTEMFSLLKRHMLLHTGDKPIFCDECNYRCVDVRSLVDHKRKHSGEKPFPCKQCEYRSATSSALRVHMATHSSEKPFACQQCAFVCKLASGLKQHVARCHEKVKNHKCPTCSKSFFRTTYLKTHILTHTGEKPHICDICGSAFGQKSNLKFHIDRKHSPGKPIVRRFACSHCSYRATALATLQKHTLKHTGEKPAACDLCDFKCTTVSALKIHKQRHMGDARFACDTCPYKCYSNDRLQAHKRIHTGERPYPCTKCDFRFSTSSGLAKHMASHNNEQQYTCANCPYTSNYKKNLVKHQKKRCGKTRKYDCTKRRAGRKCVEVKASMSISTDNEDRTMDSIAEDN